MANIPGEIVWQANNNTWFTTNAAEVFPQGITIYHTDGRYKFTDGVTALSALPFLGSGGTLGLVQIVDLAGDFFTDLATATAYIEQYFNPAIITDKSFNNGIFYFTVPNSTSTENVAVGFLSASDGISTNSASFVDEFGLVNFFSSASNFERNSGYHIMGNVDFQLGDFNEFSGIAQIQNIIGISAALNYFGLNSTGKFIIEGNLGSTEGANFGATFFSGSTATIFANASKYTSNAGGIQGDLVTAITNGCNVQFDGIDLEKVSNKSTSVVTDQASNTKYPSVKSVFDWVTANYQPKKFSYTDTVLGTATSGVGNQFSKSVLIPANTLTSGALNIKGRSVKSGSTSFAWLNVYVNTANNLTGAKQLGQINSSGFSTVWAFSIDRTIPIQSGSFTTFIINSTNGFEEVANSTQIGTATIDWTVDQYIILSCQCNIGTDTMRANFLSVNQF